jgi:hypothetical protein
MFSIYNGFRRRMSCLVFDSEVVKMQLSLIALNPLLTTPATPTILPRLNLKEMKALFWDEVGASLVVR